jgi:hypothetical protein
VLARLVAELRPESDSAAYVFLDMSAVLLGRNELGLPPSSPEERERMGDLLDAWGIGRIFWGNDNIPNYLALSRAAWPLNDYAWPLVGQQTDAALFEAE